MQLLYNDIFLEHDTGQHPENKNRLAAFADLEQAELEDGARFLHLVHPAAYIEKVRQMCESPTQIDQDTVTSLRSFEVACQAVSATVKASESGNFALVRPPGHHAYASRASGFCLFNNVAVAAAKLAKAGKKVLILDFDGHLGDGTSDIFYASDQVMYWSIHQYPAFPGHGFVNEIGEGKGKGYTINIPLPPGSADDIFINAFEYFLPVAQQFKPDVLAISAGFDAHQYEFLLDLKVSFNGYYKLGQLISANFSNFFATLEGGYNLDILPKCVYCFLAGVNGQPIPYQEEETMSGLRVWETFEINLYAAMANLRRYWKI